MASKCYCCENGAKKTMNHLLLLSLIANKLWRHFALYEGLNIDGDNLSNVMKKW